MSNISNLKSPTNKDAIEILQAAIKRVESGEITGISLSWTTRDLSVGGQYSSSPNQFLMWASIEHEARQFYKTVVDEDD